VATIISKHVQEGINDLDMDLKENEARNICAGEDSV
jgi:hypothetical protein